MNLKRFCHSYDILSIFFNVMPGQVFLFQNKIPERMIN